MGTVKEAAGVFQIGKNAGALLTRLRALIC